MNKLLLLLVGVLSFILPASPAEDKCRSAEQEHWRQQRKIEAKALALSARVAVASAIAAAAAICGVGLASYAAYEAQRQAGAALGQLKVMRDEQRPWIKVEPDEIGDFFVSNGLGTPQADLIAHFKLTNVGRAPAFHVRFFVWAFVSSFEPENKNVATEQQRRCEAVRHGHPDADTWAAMIFPENHIVDTDLGPAGARVVTTGSMPGGHCPRPKRGRWQNVFVLYLRMCGLRS
jgi:hypothetical protein